MVETFNELQVTAERSEAPDKVRRIVRVVGLGDAFLAWGAPLLQRLGDATGQFLAIVPPGKISFHEPLSPWPDQEGASSESSPLTVVLLDDTSQILLEMMRFGWDPMGAVQHITMWLASLQPVLEGPNALLVRRRQALDAASIWRMIEQPLLDACGGGVGLPHETIPGLPGWTALTSPQGLALNRQVLSPLADIIAGGSTEVVLPLACFYSGNHQGELAAPLMELAGPRRAVYFGPYYHLPTGRWQAAVQLLVLGGSAPCELLVDVFAETDLAKLEFELREPGLFQVSLAFEVVHAQKPIELRVWVNRGAIEGYVGLRHVTLNRVADEAKTQLP